MSTSAKQYPTIPMRYTFAPLSAAVWKARPDSNGLLERDLHLAAASDGQMSAVHVRAQQAGTCRRWIDVAGKTFAFLYVIDGVIRFEMPGGEIITLGKHDVVHLPFLVAAGSATYSAAFSAAEITAPGRANTKLAALLDFTNEQHVGSWEGAVCRNRAELFIQGNGPRSYFKYRDVGSSALTDGRIHIHDGGAVQAVPGTGWHTHTMSQLFMILSGEAVLEIEGYGTSRVGACDAMTLGAGMPHNVTSISADYGGFELCLPAQYDTTPIG